EPRRGVRAGCAVRGCARHVARGARPLAEPRAGPLSCRGGFPRALPRRRARGGVPDRRRRRRRAARARGRRKVRAPRPRGARGRRPVTLVLASASPRRRELVSAIGLEFVVRPTDVDEELAAASAPPMEAPVVVAVAKARAVTMRSRDVVLA